MRREDAVRFLDRVQQRLASRPPDYADFLNIMKVSDSGELFTTDPIFQELQSENLPVESAIEEINNLFKVHILIKE